jgi:hypothetical protein
MNSPFVPVALFVALVLSVIAALPLQGSLVVLSIVGFMGSLGGLAWWVLWADRAPFPAPAAEPVAAIADPFEPDWQSFENAFWAHVADHTTLDPD